MANRSSSSRSARQRPIPPELEPSAAGVAGAERVSARATNVLLAAIDQMSTLTHPIERAMGATRLLEALTAVIDEVKDVRRDAVKEAYAKGSALSGWYGYTALAHQLGISPSRVRQILYDITTDASGTPQVRDDEAATIRSKASARREALRLLQRGLPVAQVAGATGLSAAETKRLAGTVTSHD